MIELEFLGIRSKLVPGDTINISKQRLFSGIRAFFGAKTHKTTTYQIARFLGPHRALVRNVNEKIYL